MLSLVERNICGKECHVKLCISIFVRVSMLLCVFVIQLVLSDATKMEILISHPKTLS